MKIIADCGGTKGDWRYVTDGGSVTEFETPGINPTVKSSAEIMAIISENLPTGSEVIHAIRFYGAGTGTEESRNKMVSILQDYYRCQDVSVATDLLGSCRALAQNSAALVSILGTGSASCRYNGQEIVDLVPSLGYIAGDEGAGTAIGKALLQAYFYREMPPSVSTFFESGHTLDRGTILQSIYRSNTANHYIASFAGFAVKHIEHPYIAQLVKQELDKFIVRHLLKYKEYTGLECHFVGSIAWFFRNILTDSIVEYGLTPGKIIRKPIDQLVEYHTKYE